MSDSNVSGSSPSSPVEVTIPLDPLPPPPQPTTTFYRPRTYPIRRIPLDIDATASAVELLSDRTLWAYWAEALSNREAKVRCRNRECREDGCSIMENMFCCLQCFENDAIGPKGCDLPLIYIRRFMEDKPFFRDRSIHLFLHEFENKILGGSRRNDTAGMDGKLYDSLKEARKEVAQLRRSAPPRLTDRILKLQNIIDDMREENLNITAATLYSFHRWLALSEIIKIAIGRLGAGQDSDTEADIEFPDTVSDKAEGAHDPPSNEAISEALRVLKRCVTHQLIAK